MTPERAREVILEQSQFPYWGNYQRFMTAEEIAHVRTLFQADTNGNVTFARIVHRIADTTEQTLTEALLEIGVRHEESKHPRCRDLFAGESFLGSYDCFNAWTIVLNARSAA